MFLYQIAEWMEERKRLTSMIDGSKGASKQLRARKEQVEQQLLLQANKWVKLEQVKNEPFANPYVDPYTIETSNDSGDMAVMR